MQSLSAVIRQLVVRSANFAKPALPRSRRQFSPQSAPRKFGLPCPRKTADAYFARQPNCCVSGTMNWRKLKLRIQANRFRKRCQSISRQAQMRLNTMPISPAVSPGSIRISAMASTIRGVSPLAFAPASEPGTIPCRLPAGSPLLRWPLETR